MNSANTTTKPTASTLAASARISGMDHITLLTGHTQLSRPWEVSREVVQRLMPIVASASGECAVPMPMFEATHTIAVKTHETSLRAVVCAVSGTLSVPVLTIGVSLAPERDRQLWEELHASLMPMATKAARVPARPWIAARLELAFLMHPPEFMMAMGDFERCLAWTFVEHAGSSSC